MEMNGMNERGYKIKGPHWNALLLFQRGPLETLLVKLIVYHQ